MSTSKLMREHRVTDVVHRVKEPGKGSIAHSCCPEDEAETEGIAALLPGESLVIFGSSLASSNHSDPINEGYAPWNDVTSPGGHATEFPPHP
jgi:hypothetical protein